MFGDLVGLVKDVIDSLGYSGVFVIVALENVVPLIPSEVVLPFTGFLASEGRFNFWLVLLIATAAALVGASIPYFVGRWLGEDRVRAFILARGRYLMLSPHHLEQADRWFASYGGATVFFARMVPGVRAIISVPAGFAHQPYSQFALYTVLGNAIWNVLLLGAGYLLASHWQRVEDVVHPISYAIYGLMALAVLYVAYLLLKYRLAQQKQAG